MLALCQYIDMECIYCGQKTQVVNSRPQKSDKQTWRRRTCLGCRATVTTIEHILLSDALRVKKRNNGYQPFNRDKLYLSIYNAINHLADAPETATHLTATVLRHIYKATPLDPVIPSAVVAQYVAMVLKRYDAAASVRYQSFQTTMQLPNDVRRSLKS